MHLCVFLAFLQVQTSRFHQAQVLSEQINLLQKDWTLIAE